MTRPANDKHFDQHHEYSREKGYVPAEYEHQEYPKVLNPHHTRKDENGKDVPVPEIVAQSAEHEAELREEHAELLAGYVLPKELEPKSEE